MSRLAPVLLLSAALCQADEPRNLLLNPDFAFHCLDNSRLGHPASFRAGAVPGWEQDAYGDAEAWRAVRLPQRLPTAVENVVVLHPGKRFAQFVLLAEVGLDAGDHVSLAVQASQPAAGGLQAAVHVLQLDSATGDWKPSDYGQQDARTFPKHSRGELVRRQTRTATSPGVGVVEVRLDDATIAGGFTEKGDRSTDQPNPVAVLVEFTNTLKDKDVQLWSPSLVRGTKAVGGLPAARPLPELYRALPRTMQKLWRGEPLHVICMGSSIDRGSANPPLYLYDEDPASPKFKQPLSKGAEFDGALVGHPEWTDYFGRWQHYFMYTGRLKRALMRKFNLPANKLLFNIMACDGSCIGEAHSGLADYAGLKVPPDPETTGHRGGKSWAELYPPVFARPEGPRPDLVIFGSGANENILKADEIALFEGQIRWFQRHYPGTEFVFCVWQNRESYTSSTGHLMELALRYGIPYVDLGRVVDDITRTCNSYALVPQDGHPQAAAHDIWARQLERAFEAADPIAFGFPQQHLPERVHPETIAWEGEMVTYTAPTPRLHGTAFVLDETVANVWATTTDEALKAYVDGRPWTGSRLRPMGQRDRRNSTCEVGGLALGDRHILELTGTAAKVAAMDMKTVPTRRWFGVGNPAWQRGTLQPVAYRSEWGAPYGEQALVLPAGGSVTIDVPATVLSAAWVDRADGGSLAVTVDGAEQWRQATNVPFTTVTGEKLLLENRRGVRGLPYGWHTVTLTAVGQPVTLLGLYTYDTRSNRANERVIRGWASPGETVAFPQPFGARPLVFCTGGLAVKAADVSAEAVKFSGAAAGGFEVVGE